MESDQQIERAQWYRKRGRYECARDILTQLAQAEPRSTAVHVLLGDTLAQLGQWDEAVLVFRKAIGLNPDSETASLALFHCLWKHDDREQAFEEMKRYMAEHDSQEYKEILRGLAEELG